MKPLKNILAEAEAENSIQTLGKTGSGKHAHHDVYHNVYGTDDY